MTTQIDTKKALLGTYVGSAIGFISFLVLGAVPALLYGGYMGLIMVGALFGTPAQPTLVARVIVGGGMVLGLVASLFLFLVVGALLGSLVAWAVRPLAGKVLSQQALPTTPVSPEK